MRLTVRQLYRLKPDSKLLEARRHAVLGATFGHNENCRRLCATTLTATFFLTSITATMKMKFEICSATWFQSFGRQARVAVLSLLLANTGLVSAADWPQYGGPNDDGVSPEKISVKWPAEGPRQVWKIPLTGGFSVMTVSQGRAYSLVLRSVEGADQEVCVAMDADTG